MRKALLIVDVQNDYFPGGKNRLVGPVEASLKAKELLEAFRKARSPVVHVRHISTRAGATYFLPDTPGSDFHDNVRPIPGETIIIKHFPNSFRETELAGTLEREGVEGLVVCGMMTHMCIDSTVRAAFDRGFECIVAGDACATKDLVFGDMTIPAPFVHSSFLAALNGMFAKVVTAEEAIGETCANR